MSEALEIGELDVVVLRRDASALHPVTKDDVGVMSAGAQGTVVAVIAPAEILVEHIDDDGSTLAFVRCRREDVELVSAFTGPRSPSGELLDG